jgi:hypothetical protein
MAYQEFIHRPELGFQTLSVDFERKLMVLVDLYSRPNYIFEAIGHSWVILEATAVYYWQNVHVPSLRRVGTTSSACWDTPWRTLRPSE